MRRSTLVASLALLCVLLVPSFSSAAPPPTTGFEQSGGASFTTHEQEVAFLNEVATSPRVALSEIGTTLRDRPVHLVELGFPEPHGVEDALEHPTVLFTCSQHGNEPSGREACLRWLRDLAFTDDPVLIDQLKEQTILFVPAANPDGRAADTRENGSGVDINRDHLNLRSPEAQAMAAVVRDYQPDVVVDLHEFGPGLPGVYDDEILYLWPRNLNVDPQVRGAARILTNDYIVPGAEANGQRAGEYGRYRTPVGDYHITQQAGDDDEGIARNAMGLRHAAGILLETRIDGSPRTSVDDVTSEAALNNRRVDTHYQAIEDTLRYMRDNGPMVSFVNSNAAERKTREGAEGSAPVYFNGQDQDGTLLGDGDATPTSVADPPPCGYRLTAAQYEQVSLTFLLQGIAAEVLDDGGAFVSMAQPAEPVIPLLLDARGNRHSVTAEPLTQC